MIVVVARGHGDHQAHGEVQFGVVGLCSGCRLRLLLLLLRSGVLLWGGDGRRWQGGGPGPLELGLGITWCGAAASRHLIGDLRPRQFPVATAAAADGRLLLLQGECGLLWLLGLGTHRGRGTHPLLQQSAQVCRRSGAVARSLS